ncbi:MAG: hypothetical protein Q9167_003559 [Letrouitia subvulpina]
METTTPLPTTTLTSPKRKRDTKDPLDQAFVPPTARLRIADLPTTSTCSSVEREYTGEGSPRTTVARHLQNLNLTGQTFDFGQLLKEQQQQQPPPGPAMAVSDFDGAGGSLPANHQQHQQQQRHQQQEAAHSDLTPSMLSAINPPFFQTDTNNTNLPPDVPETPRLRPTNAPSPLLSPVSRCKSPPPMNLWWAEAEITGHNPTDPADDGYGINGVGFLPTPATANARAERRKKQVAEWKNREAKEARQKRSDRRRRRDVDLAAEGGSATDGGSMPERRVRFLEV